MHLQEVQDGSVPDSDRVQRYLPKALQPRFEVKLRTWHFELAVVFLALAGVNLLIASPPLEWVGAGAVLLSFGHAAISDRMAEKQAQMIKPDVDCYRWSWRYFIGKEALWVVYFILHHSYSALVGCGVFLAYPFWRVWYRRRWPSTRTI